MGLIYVWHVVCTRALCVVLPNINMTTRHNIYIFVCTERALYVTVFDIINDDFSNINSNHKQRSLKKKNKK